MSEEPLRSTQSLIIMCIDVTGSVPVFSVREFSRLICTIGHYFTHNRFELAQTFDIFINLSDSSTSDCATLAKKALLQQGIVAIKYLLHHSIVVVQ
jgi:hypothetical protein